MKPGSYTNYTVAAKQVMSAYRNYLRCGYSRKMARKLARFMVEDARRFVYPLIAT